MTDHGDASSGTPQARVDRRALLRKGVAAGTIAWTAPLITSSVVAAADGTCTPKCLPRVTTSVSVPAATSPGLNGGGNCPYPIVINPAPICPCGGTRVTTWSTPVLTGELPNPPLFATSFIGYYGPLTLNGPSLTLPIEVRWYQRIRVTGTLAVSCTDRAGDPCLRTFNWTAVIPRTTGATGTCPATSPGTATFT